MTPFPKVQQWAAEVPLLEFDALIDGGPDSAENDGLRALANRTEYLHANGLPNWRADIAYPPNAYIKWDGGVWRAKQSNTGQEPQNNLDDWERCYLTQDDLDARYAVSSSQFTQADADLLYMPIGATAGMPRLTTGQALPTSNIGPIWHDDYAAIMTWQVFNANGANYTGYASVNIGALMLDTQATARPGYLPMNASVSTTAYAALFNWAKHQGQMLSSGLVGQYFRDWADGTFNLPSYHDAFLRIWRPPSMGGTRDFGSWQDDELESHTHPIQTRDDEGGVGGPADGGGVNSTLTTTGATGGDETRPKNVALLAAFKF